jgi:glutamate dehydrogenase/leucine dehydrogenase
MIALLIEEAADQSSVADELLRVRWRFQDNIGPIITVEEWSSAEDMKTSSAAMSTRRDEIRPRRKVRARVTGVVRHRQCVEIGVAGGRRLG